MATASSQRLAPSAGPAITATVKTEELIEMARGNRSCSTRKGSSDWPEGPANPRAAPNRINTK